MGPHAKGGAFSVTWVYPMMEVMEPPFSGHVFFLSVTEAGFEPRTSDRSHNSYNVLMKPNENKSRQGWPESLQGAASLSSARCDLWAVLLRSYAQAAAGLLSQSLVVAEKWD